MTPWVWIKRILVVLSLVTLITPLLDVSYRRQAAAVPLPAKRLVLTTLTTSQGPWTSSIAMQTLHLNLYSGDGAVRAQTINRVASIVQNDAWPTLSTIFATAAVPDANIILFGSQAGYESAVSENFAGNAVDIAAKTGGFTVGTTVYLPIYKYVSPGPVANTIAHELTHVFLNVTGISRVIPQWLNEGFAWTIGLKAENAVDPAQVQTLLAQLTAQFDAARQSGHMAPLTTATDVGLQKNFEYNLEFEDYLAVKQLETGYGSSALPVFLRNTIDVGLTNSFAASFGIGLTSYERAFYNGFAVH